MLYDHVRLCLNNGLCGQQICKVSELMNSPFINSFAILCGSMGNYWSNYLNLPWIVYIGLCEIRGKTRIVILPLQISGAKTDLLFFTAENIAAYGAIYLRHLTPDELRKIIMISRVDNLSFTYDKYTRVQREWIKMLSSVQ